MGLCPTVCLPLWLTFRKPPAPGWLGPRGGAGLPAGRAVPTSSRLGPEQHKGADCSHRGAWASRHSGHCVRSRGCGLSARHCWPACRAGAGSRPPWTPARLSRGRDGRQRAQAAACSSGLSPPTGALPLDHPELSETCPGCTRPSLRPPRPWASLPQPVQRGKLRPSEDKAVRTMGFEATPAGPSSTPSPV